MMRSRKYLVVTGIVFIILVIYVFVNKSWSNDNATMNKNITDLKENKEIEKKMVNNTMENNSMENNDMMADEENSYEKDTVTKQNNTKINQDIEVEIDKLISKYYDVSNEINVDNPTIDDQSKEDQTIESITKMREAIEAYKNIKTYVKPGLEKDSYVVFTTYDIKLYNIDTLVPGMSVISVIKDEKDVLSINNESNDKELNNYIKQLASDKDIKSIIEEVNTKLSEAIKKDESLKEFIDYIKGVS